MSWIDRDLQKQILSNLVDSYGTPISETELAKKLWPDKALEFWKPIPERLAEILKVDDTPHNELADKFIKNIIYLSKHSLISLTDISSDFLRHSGTRLELQIEITHRGLDFLEQDGGLSAILGIVTFKLHNETVQQLLTDKINQSDMPEAEKSELKAAISTIKDAALTKVTELAIEKAPWAAILAAIKQTIGH